MTDLEVVGRLVRASNEALLLRDGAGQYIYKPVRGERPLWDFPDGTLANRERAAFVLSELLGWGIVPRTRLMDGPLGPGSVQDWVDGDVTLVDVVAADGADSGWIEVFRGVDDAGRPVSLVHRDDAVLARIAAFDVLANNADRKGGHLLTTSDGLTFGIDHGVTFHEEPKLRTVLWGWAGMPLDETLVEDVGRALPAIAASELAELLDDAELAALTDRMRAVVDTRVYPHPSDAWPSIPWPVF